MFGQFQMETSQERRMNISWVFADTIELDPLFDLQAVKDVGPIWGSWKTWRSCQTDNVVCHDLNKTRELLQRNFQTRCNFFIPNNAWTVLERPDGVNLYEGSFVDEFQPEEIIAMHLAGSQNDIVLLLGFDWSEKPKNANRLTEHQYQAYRALILHAMEQNPTTQWVLVDHSEPVMKMLNKLENLTKDSIENCLGLKDL